VLLSTHPCLRYRLRHRVQQGPFALRTLLRFNANTSLAATVSPSADFPVDAGYTAVLAPPISRWDEDGFSSCSACPCHRAIPTQLELNSRHSRFTPAHFGRFARARRKETRRNSRLGF
jgi:hypothetical protein